MPIQLYNPNKKVNYIHFIRREYDERRAGNLEQVKRNDSYAVEGSKKMDPQSSRSLEITSVPERARGKR